MAGPLLPLLLPAPKHCYHFARFATGWELDDAN